MFRKAVIIGVGQLGASIGMNLVSRRLASEVIGIGRSRANLKVAKSKKAIHRIGTIRELSRGDATDLIVLATPVRTIRESLKRLPKKPLIIDVGSTKTSIVEEASRRKLRFVGCHPIAGTEKGGAGAGDAALFRGKTVLLTPTRRSSAADLRRVQSLWKRCGAKVVMLTPEEHDRVFSVTSHLPHALAFALCRVAGKGLKRNQAKFIFTSFKDATRVAASPVEMWRDIFLENRSEVLKALSEIIHEVKSLQKRITSKKEKSLLEFLASAQKMRQKLVA